MVESWRKVIPGLSMIKLTPHRVSQILFCALDTLAAAYSTLSRVQSHLSCWHHCIAITVSERENTLSQGSGKRIKEIYLFALLLPLILRSTNTKQMLKILTSEMFFMSSITSQIFCCWLFYVKVCVFAAFLIQVKPQICIHYYYTFAFSFQFSVFLKQSNKSNI